MESCIDRLLGVGGLATTAMRLRAGDRVQAVSILAPVLRVLLNELRSSPVILKGPENLVILDGLP